jgi:hypothetical protein
MVFDLRMPHMMVRLDRRSPDGKRWRRGLVALNHR